MGKPIIPLCWLVEELDSNGETILTGKLGRGQLGGQLMNRDDGVRLWAIGLTENDCTAQSRKHYAKRKRRGEA